MSPAANSVFSITTSPGPQRLRRSPSRLIVEGNWKCAWQEAVTDRLNGLLILPVGWDGYRAPPVSLENVFFAAELLRAVCPPDMPAPQIVPGSAGDLQIEWHIGNTVVELHVTAPNAVSAWRETPQIPDGEELELTNDFLPIIPWIEALRGAAVAPVTAAA